MLHYCTTANPVCVMSGLIPLGTVGNFYNCTSYKYYCIVHSTPNMLGGFTQNN